MRRTLSWAALLVAALTGCTHPLQPRLTPHTALGTTSQIEDLVRLAITLDVASDRAADTLYASDALVVANGRVRVTAPRFAGVSYGGRVTIATASVTLEGPFAWVLLDYRWFNLQQNQAEAGRATFICQNRGAGWKIVHVHSSQLLPWDR
jgi:hypothetical protein